MRHDAGQPLGEPLLMRRIGVGVEQADRDALDRMGLQPGDQPVDLGLGEWFEYRARRIHPLGDAEAQLRRHQRRRLGPHIEAIEVLPAIARDLQHVLEAGSGDQRHFRQALLDQRVGHPRRAMDEAADIIRA